MNEVNYFHGHCYVHLSAWWGLMHVDPVIAIVWSQSTVLSCCCCIINECSVVGRRSSKSRPCLEFMQRNRPSLVSRTQLIVMAHLDYFGAARSGKASARGVIVSFKSEVWIGLSSVLRPRQHNIGYLGDGFYRSKDPTNSIKVLKEITQKYNKQT